MWKSSNNETDATRTSEVIDRAAGTVQTHLVKDRQPIARGSSQDILTPRPPDALLPCDPSLAGAIRTLGVDVDWIDARPPMLGEERIRTFEGRARQRYDTSASAQLCNNTHFLYFSISADEESITFAARPPPAA